MPMPSRVRLAPMALALLVAAATAAPAAAQPRGEVRVDPDTPAGTEYAIPLEQARRNAGDMPMGDAGEGSSGSRGEQALFGAGVERPQEASTSTTRERSGTARSRDADDDAVPSTGRDPASGETKKPTTASLSSSGSSSNSLTVAAIIAAVLLLGGGLGLGLRRVLRDS